MTEEQTHACNLLKNGGNVSVEAVPGAGKSAMLIRACFISPKPCLVVAYNTVLCSDLNKALQESGLSDDVSCMTFHSLCSKCIGPARDDVGIRRAVEAVYKGDVEARDVPIAQRVLVDEAQDVRDVYVSLLRCLRLCPPFVPTMLVGDRMQLIYDFDPDFPATEETLLSPRSVFGGEWTGVSLRHTFRLTDTMAPIVRSLFGVDIVSTCKGGEKVEVIAANQYRLFDSLKHILLADDAPDKLLLLVDKKRGNRPLCNLLNALSEKGKKVNVHGVDSDDPSSLRGKIRCSTWWAAKGAQADTVICVVPQFTPVRPLYVGLTRAFNKLTIVLYEKALHNELCKTIASVEETVRMDAKTRRLVLEESRREAVPSSFEEFVFGSDEPLRLRCLDSWRASSKTTEALSRAEDVEGGTQKEHSNLVVKVGGGGYEDATCAVVKMCLVYVEMVATGRVRHMEDVLNPLRIDVSEAPSAVRCGMASRYLSTKRLPTDNPLPLDLLKMGREAYERCLSTKADPDLADVAIVSLSALAWDNYEHVMRQLLPVTSWCYSPTVSSALTVALTNLPSKGGRGVEFDYKGRYTLDDVVFFSRVVAKDDDFAYCVCFGEESASLSQEVTTSSCVCAALHPKKACKLIDLEYGWVKTIRVERPSLLFQND